MVNKNYSMNTSSPAPTVLYCPTAGVDSMTLDYPFVYGCMDVEFDNSQLIDNSEQTCVKDGSVSHTGYMRDTYRCGKEMNNDTSTSKDKDTRRRDVFCNDFSQCITIRRTS